MRRAGSKAQPAIARIWRIVGPTSRRRAGMALLALASVAGVTACDAGPTPDTPLWSPADQEANAGAAATRTAPVRDTALEADIRDAAARIDGVVGVAVLHLQDDVIARVNEGHSFPLASVYKLPIAYVALRDGAIGPADSVRVTDADRAPGATPLAAGTAVPAARLVERSLAHSDNTASDVLLRLAGGPDEVNRQVREAGVREVHVHRTMAQVFADWSAGGPDAFVADPRDTGTPEGIVALLAAIHRGDGLHAEGRRLLLEALQAADTGPNRIRAGVPAGTTVAHKTGTLGPLTHDAGIITLPGGRDVALAILIQSDAPLPDREAVIAAVARAVWDRFAAAP
jgi:beta-lactamase class A